MNIDSTSNIILHKVTSKYFTKEHMDDSLTDFQETKKSCTGPKNTKTSTKQTKKPSKRTKGQRDIRSALKSKKSELVSYTKEFDIVCKNSGIDVDSEQLQLAVALSKSLQTEINREQVPSTSQERTKRIRTTLQEYGFKVPEIKIIKKKLRKYQKKYKLLGTPETEKLQIISDRYSTVLFHNLDHYNTSLGEDNSKAFLYHLTTNISYDKVKNNNIFYFNNLIKKSTSDCCLLRNWAEIPGRPVSPKHSVTLNMNFSEITCSQEELDIVLSGSLKCTKKILQSKHRDSNNPAIMDNNTENSNKTKSNLVPKVILDTETIVIGKKNITIEDLGLNTEPIMATQYRSFSPDIFDDDDTSLLDITKSTTYFQEKKQNTDIMDLTECVNVFPQYDLQYIITSKDQPKSQLSQKSDTIKRNSDDIMEITECVASSSQPLVVVNNIDLTQSPNFKKSTAIIDEKYKSSEDFNTMDLTQSSDSSDLPAVQLSYTNKNDLDNTIILNADEHIGITKKTFVSVRRGSTDEILNATQKGHINENNESFFEEFLHDHSESKDLAGAESDGEDTRLKCASTITENEEFALTEDLNDSHKCLDNSMHHKESDNIFKSSSLEESVINKDKINLIQSSSTSDEEENSHEVLLDKKTEQIDSKNGIVWTSLPDNSKYSKYCDIDLTQASNSSEEISNNVQNFIGNDIYASSCSLKSDLSTHHDSEDRENDIDMTQTSNSSVELQNHIPETSLKTCNNSSLGKKDDVSIDYDEICERTNKIKDHSKNNLNESSFKSVVYEINDEHNREKVENEHMDSSQTNEIFSISDRELDYSLHQSNNENFKFGGISIMNDFSSTLRYSKSSENQILYNNLDALKNDSFLPEVDIKRKGHDINETVVETVDAINKRVTEVFNPIETPNNKDYIIKTDNVTPMLEYASMTTPQRNRELDKYGLKPFKRKRAIQILTHLYNQTHPIVESIDEDLQSPSKKSKKYTNHESPNVSPKKLSKSPRTSAVQSGDTDTVLYEVTNEVPDMREVNCCDDDWVFQKREKAKVHSCRVPLHIAFHNYVSCRRALLEAILRYEPINIDIIHRQLVGYGHKYDPKELLRFMDKKCITVKTTDNNARNNRY